MAQSDINRDAREETFPVPGRIYGRKNEIQDLSRIFKEVEGGAKEYLNITGPSGIGKTTLVRDLFRPLVKDNSYYISGKCDQMKGAPPYNSIIQAFRGFVKDLLEYESDHIDKWNRSIIEAVGTSGRVITDVIPEIEEIIGPQDQVPELGTEESCNRFNMVFTRFIRVFTGSDRPLVMFIDDLQWVDSASLSLLKYILLDSEVRSFLLIGSYRDNEVSEYHGVSIAVRELAGAGIFTGEIRVPPLDYNDIKELIRDTLCNSSSGIKVLAEFTFNHTKGNPLYINHFLKSLYEDSLIQMDETEGWKWNFKDIESNYAAADAADLMARGIMRLPEEDKDLLILASCAGNCFNLKTLELVSGCDRDTVSGRIQKLVSGGYIRPLWNEYCFSHDKIYEAAYGMISESEKKDIHYRIGRVLLNNLDENEKNEKIFDIVNQLNLGAVHVRDDNERYVLAELNLKAGLRAKLSVAYESAAAYLGTGMSVLPLDSWSARYDLVKRMASERFECEYLCGNFEEAYHLFVEIKKNCRTSIEIAQLYNLNSLLLMNMGSPLMAIQYGINGLKLLGVKIRTWPGMFRLLYKKVLLMKELRKKDYNDLILLPEMHEEMMKNRMSILLNTWFPSHLVNNRLRKLISYEMVRLSLVSGNCEHSPVGFLGYGITLGLGMHRYREACEYGMFALSLNEKYVNAGLRCRLETLFGAYLSHWTNHVDTGIGYLRGAHKKGVESGEIYYAGVAAVYQMFAMFFKGESIPRVCKTSRNYLDFSEKNRDPDVYNGLQVFYRNTRCLMGETAGITCLSDETFNEDEFRELIRKQEVLQPYYLYLICRARLLYLFGKYEEALECCPREKELFEYHYSTIVIPEYIFIKSLILTALYEKVSIAGKLRYLLILNRHLRLMKKWKESCPENFLHKYYLIEAEIKRITGRDIQAMKLYSLSIDSAKKNGYTCNEAMSGELAAGFYLSRGFNDLAVLHISTALEKYKKWGVITKVAQVNQTWSDLLEPGDSLFPAAQKGDPQGTERLESVLSMMSGISGDMLRKDLIASILNIIYELSGPGRCCVLVNIDGRFHIEAEAGSVPDENESAYPVPVSADNMPLSVLKQSTLQSEVTIIRDIQENDNFKRDPYLLKNAPRNILIIPLIVMRKAIAIIYKEFENDIIMEHCLKILKILTPQITVSLANSPVTGTDEIDGKDEKASKTYLRGLDVDRALMELEKLMEVDRLYKIEDFSLAMLAKEMSLSTQQLTELLNDRLNVNFNTYINSFRVGEAKKLLIQQPESPVLSIAYEVGFNSVSTFYSAFVKFTGVSPAKYRSNSLKESDMQADSRF